MCGRFAQHRPASELAEIFAAEPLADELGPRYNVAPTDEALVVVQREERRAITAYRWGLIPHWADAARVGSRMFNARAETLTSSPAFRDALERKRCLVPVDGFYEWKRDGATLPPSGRQRLPRACSTEPIPRQSLTADQPDPIDAVANASAGLAPRSRAVAYAPTTVANAPSGSRAGDSRTVASSGMLETFARSGTTTISCAPDQRAAATTVPSAASSRGSATTTT